MPNAIITTIITPLAPGLWNVDAYAYFNTDASAETRIRDGQAWAELVEVDFWGTEKIVAHTTTYDGEGHILFSGIPGSDSDGAKKMYRVYTHWQRGYPGTRTGPEYWTNRDFYLGLNEYELGPHKGTVVIPLASMHAAGLVSLPAPMVVAPLAVGALMAIYGARRR